MRFICKKKNFKLISTVQPRRKPPQPAVNLQAAVGRWADGYGRLSCW